jgi:hypothetical protein
MVVRGGGLANSEIFACSLRILGGQKEPQIYRSRLEGGMFYSKFKL